MMKASSVWLPAHALLVVALTALLGCGGPDAASDHERSTSPQRSTLELSANGDDLLLTYERATDASGPRIVEVLVRHSETLQLEEGVPGSAAVAAGKDVIVQRRDPTTLRVLVFSSSNTQELDSGVLAVLRLNRTSEAPARAEILLDKPLFAPQSAQRGLTVSDPITF